jgi:hypothetical protein
MVFAENCHAAQTFLAGIVMPIPQKLSHKRKSEIVEPQNFLIVRETKSTTYFPKKILGSIPTATKGVIDCHTARSVFLKGIN